jgi:hypothetical protein
MAYLSLPYPRQEERVLPESLKAFVPPMMAMARKQFPRDCPSCRRRYADFEQYIRETVPGAITMNYPFDPMGMISWVRCGCGNTLTLRCEEMTGDTHRQFLKALENESKASGRALDHLMGEIRDEVRRRATA